MSRVSVIIPSYNQGQFLGKAIQSILDQDYADIEVIVVNDGSTDDTRQVAAGFGKYITYVEQPNKGAASARNLGIRNSSGEYIAFLDADDVSLPGRLRLEAEILNTHHETGLVATDAYLIDSKGQILGLKSELSGVPRNANDFRWETVEYCATTSTVMVRRKYFEEVGLFEERIPCAGGEDWLAWVRMSLSCSMVYLNIPTIYYRLHEANITRSQGFINHQNRVASHLAITWDRFSTYPAHFRAKLLFYRFATAWHESKRTAAIYFLRALATDPAQLPFGLSVIRQGLRNTLQRLYKRL